MSIELTEEQQQVLKDQRGFAAGPSYVVMSKETYCRMMGIESEDDLAESLAAIDRALADFEAGRSRPLSEFLSDFRSRHEISG